jgi:hypothetical protein
MDDDTAPWQYLLSKEVALREALSRLGPGAASTDVFKDTLRQWWAAIEAALDFYIHALAEGKALSSPPPDILSSMKSFADYLAVGQIPGPIADAASEGRRSPGPSERRDIGFGVAYLLAAKNGFEHLGERIFVLDRTPVKTVAAAFGVHPSTVHGWKNKISPSSPGIHRADGKLLTFLMKEAGERYRKAGRSSSAIRARDRRN